MVTGLLAYSHGDKEYDYENSYLQFNYIKWFEFIFALVQLWYIVRTFITVTLDPQ
jgi:hypothetical protein